nr:MAG TPA: protein of unknown function (DUF4708) [Caudoviricetes sp.]
MSKTFCQIVSVTSLIPDSPFRDYSVSLFS